MQASGLWEKRNQNIGVDKSAKDISVIVQTFHGSLEGYYHQHILYGGLY